MPKSVWRVGEVQAIKEQHGPALDIPFSEHARLGKAEYVVGYQLAYDYPLGEVSGLDIGTEKTTIYQDVWGDHSGGPGTPQQAVEVERKVPRGWSRSATGQGRLAVQVKYYWKGCWTRLQVKGTFDDLRTTKTAVNLGGDGWQNSNWVSGWGTERWERESVNREASLVRRYRYVRRDWTPVTRPEEEEVESLSPEREVPRLRRSLIAAFRDDCLERDRGGRGPGSTS